MTPRSITANLAAVFAVTLVAAFAAGAMATLFLLTGRPALLAGNFFLVGFGAWLARRWLVLLVTAVLIEDAAAKRAWSGEAR